MIDSSAITASRIVTTLTSAKIFGAIDINEFEIVTLSEGILEP
ncbi:hypothetical protein [Phormidesmis priestleyi]|nr:hypothetical protein [Phormidesmis priestleyi]